MFCIITIYNLILRCSLDIYLIIALRKIRVDLFMIIIFFEASIFLQTFIFHPISLNEHAELYLSKTGGNKYKNIKILSAKIL